MTTSWIDIAKENTFDSVAANLGIKQKGYRYGPCPACGAETASKKDKRLPIGRTRGTNSAGWRCFVCTAGGDMLDLVSYKLMGNRLRDVNDYTHIKEFFQIKNFQTVEVTEPQKEDIPSDDLYQLFESMEHRKVSDANHRHVDAYLRTRGINPREVREATVFSPEFNYLSLTKVETSSGKKMPFWPYAWSRDYPICVPLFDNFGRMKNFQGRAVTKLDSGRKTMCPVGYNMSGYVFQCHTARHWFTQENPVGEFWIVEGEIDFLHLASIFHDDVDVAVIGVKNGSLPFFQKAQFPATAKIIIATDNDEKGDEYASKIAEAIYPHKPVRLKLNDHSDINEALQDGIKMNDIHSMIKPFPNYEQIISTIGMNLLKSTFRNCENAKRTDRVKGVTSLVDHVEALAETFRLQNDQATKMWYRLQSLHGCGKVCGKIKERINMRVLGHQEQERHDNGIISKELEGPDPAVRLVRKPIKERGVIIGYGEIKTIEQNLVEILGKDRRLKSRFRYNEHSDTVEIDGKPITDNKVLQISIWLQEHYEGFRMELTIVGRGIDYVASLERNTYHPVLEMLQELYTVDLEDAPDHARPEELWSYYFGADLGPNNMYAELIEQYGILFCITLVKRALAPGCKADTLPVLIGPQGCGKSTGLRALAVKEDFFSDTPFDVKNKDAYQMLRGVWIYEIGEAESLLRGGFRAVKGFITAQVDRYRKPYRSHVTASPRGGAFATTTNEPQIEFLSDPSGSRRYHAMMVGRYHNVRVNELKEDAKYIWARAMHMYHGTGEYIEAGPMQENWLQDQQLQELSRRLNEKFGAGDPWIDFIGSHCQGLWNEWAFQVKTQGDTKQMNKMRDVDPKRVLSDVLQITAGHQTRREMKRCTEVLSQLGCKPSGQRRVGQKRVNVWTIPKDFSDLEKFDISKYQKNNLDNSGYMR